MDLRHVVEEGTVKLTVTGICSGHDFRSIAEQQILEHLQQQASGLRGSNVTTGRLPGS